MQGGGGTEVRRRAAGTTSAAIDGARGRRGGRGRHARRRLSPGHGHQVEVHLRVRLAWVALVGVLHRRVARPCALPELGGGVVGHGGQHVAGGVPR